MNRDKDLFEKFNSDSGNITLPESLSRDNIVNKIKNTPQAAVVKTKENKKAGLSKKKTVNIAVSFAAAFAIIIGIGAIGFNQPSSTDSGANTGLLQSSNNIETAGYEDIENLVADYYKNNTDKYYTYNNSGWNLFGSFTKDSAAKNQSSAETVTDTAGIGDKRMYSETNTQVSGIDEGDIVKTDGKYIYVLSSGRVYVLDASDAKNVKSVLSFPVYYNEDEENTYYTSDEMYVIGSRIVTIVRVGKRIAEAYDGNGYSEIIACGVPDYENTVVNVTDISDINAPVMVFSYAVSSRYVSSRLSDGKLILVGEYNIPYGSSVKNEDERIANIKSKCVPTEIVNGTAERRINANNITVSDSDAPVAYQTVLMFDVNNCEDTFYSGASLGGAGDIYCDGEYLFVSYGDWYENKKTVSGISTYSVTKIRAYKITDSAITLSAEGELPGYIIGQFAMDRYSDCFRVAVTVEDEQSKSYVFTLDEKMNIIGKSEPFGIDENMMAVRFMGDTAYAVTFYNTDPLFVIDLSDPKSPTLKGELKIPGFSSYLHPVGDNLVIGIGADGDDNGTNGNSVIRLFDVSDPTAPKAVDSIIIKEQSVNTDSRAFVSFGDGRYAVLTEKYTYSVSGTSSIASALVFEVKSSALSTLGAYNGSVDESMYDMRAVYIDNTLFVVGGRGVVSYDLASGEKLGLCVFNY